MIEEDEYFPIILQNMNPAKIQNQSNQLLFISLMIGESVLHNAILESGGSTRVIHFPIMYKLGLKVSRPYRNICSVDFREVKVCGLVKDV